MNVTFLLNLNLDDLSDLNGVANEIEDDLSAHFTVNSVKPWARPAATPTANPLTTIPPITEAPQT